MKEEVVGWSKHGRSKCKGEAVECVISRVYDVDTRSFMRLDLPPLVIPIPMLISYIKTAPNPNPIVGNESMYITHQGDARVRQHNGHNSVEDIT